MKKILSRLRRAISDFNMIEDGDNIVVGISGGKDSILLFYALSQYRRFAKERFDLTGVYIDMGLNIVDSCKVAEVRDFLEKNDSQLIVEKTNIAEVIFDIRKESNPCSLCSKMRRGALCTKANALGATKIALAHHADDVLETLLMSFMFEGRISTFKPTSFLDKTGVTVIRPFVYLDEREIKVSVIRNNLPVWVNPCPYDKNTKREYMKDLVKNICKDIPFAKERMISAISHPDRYNLWDNLTK